LGFFIFVNKNGRCGTFRSFIFFLQGVLFPEGFSYKKKASFEPTIPPYLDYDCLLREDSNRAKLSAPINKRKIMP